MLGAFHAADVEIDPGPALQFALLVVDRHAARQDRMPTIIGAAKLKFHVPMAAGPHARFPFRDRPLGIVGMHGRGPAKACALFLRQADQSQERGAGVGVFPLRVAQPDAVIDGFADGPINTLAFAQRLFDATARASRLAARDGAVDRGRMAPTGRQAAFDEPGKNQNHASRDRAGDDVGPHGGVVGALRSQGALGEEPILFLADFVDQRGWRPSDPCPAGWRPRRQAIAAFRSATRRPAASVPAAPRSCRELVDLLPLVGIILGLAPQRSQQAVRARTASLYGCRNSSSPDNAKPLPRLGIHDHAHDFGSQVQHMVRVCDPADIVTELGDVPVRIQPVGQHYDEHGKKRQAAPLKIRFMFYPVAVAAALRALRREIAIRLA